MHPKPRATGFRILGAAVLPATHIQYRVDGGYLKDEMSLKSRGPIPYTMNYYMVYDYEP